MENLGIKRLNKKNWLEPDSSSKLFVRLSADGSHRDMSGEEWLEMIFEPELNKGVPEDINKLFEVARGTMIYGYFFYPLFTLGMEQLFRIVETAVTSKCKEMKAPQSVKTLKLKIDFLVENKVILKEDKEKWQQGIRGFRNMFSHPESQTILSPGNTIGILQFITKEINSLFQ